jgi:hypothetical protein
VTRHFSDEAQPTQIETPHATKPYEKPEGERSGRIVGSTSRE